MTKNVKDENKINNSKPTLKTCKLKKVIKLQ